MNLEVQSTSDLMWLLLSGIPDELRRRGVKISRNVIGSYGELVACQTLGMIPAAGNTRGYDALDGESRVQIKTRYTGKMQMGGIRSAEYDEVVFLHLNDRAEVTSALRFPRAVVDDYARKSEHQNSKILVVSKKVIEDPRVVDITSIFMAAQGVIAA